MSLLGSKLGKCNVCGRPSVFMRWHDTDIRNDLKCVFCGSCARKRHLVKFLVGTVDPSASSLRALFKKRRPRVFSAGVMDAFTKLFSEDVSWTFSALKPGVANGAQLGPNVTCQDLESLTYPDGAFDIVITEDVMEHVRDDRRAFSEINRVLVPGGWHFFTTPLHLFSRTITRVRVEGERDVHLLPVEYHLEPTGGKALVYRLYGYDLVEMLSELGFDTQLHPAYYVDRWIGVYDNFVFASRKRS